MKQKSNCNPFNGCGSRSGFTLVEMLLVLSILALLAAIVLPNLLRHGPQARITAAGLQIKAFEQSLQLFALDTGRLPGGKNGLNDLVQQPRNVSNWHGPYVDTIPLDPWGNAYTYECPGRHRPTSFDLISAGPDGQLGTADDIVSWPTNGSTAVTAR